MDLFEPQDFLSLHLLDSNALTLSIDTTNKVLAVGWYWHSYQQSADFHFELWHPEISWSRNNIPGLRDFQIIFIDRWSTGPDISKWTKLAEGRNNNQTHNHGVKEKTNRRGRSQSPFILFGVLSFASPWALSLLFIGLTFLLYSLWSSVRNYQH